MSRKYPRRAEKILQSVTNRLIPKEKDRKFRQMRILPWLKQSQSDIEVLKRVYMKSFSYLAMASQQAKRNPVLARKFLQQGVDNLISLKWAMKKNRVYDTEFTPARCLAVFLPIAEKVDPALADELFWRVLAIRMKPIMQELKDRDNRNESRAVLAAILARYDIDVAKTVLQPIIEQAIFRTQSGKPWAHFSIFEIL